ncbi:Phosphoglycerate mutase family protein [Minicystis rosea]|nr:Phosphoglycerate mutase family protein [Minicystis rosea]
MPPTKIILVRHGETDDNKNSVFQGQQGRGLNAKGRDQAARLAARLAGAGIALDALYTSDLERAHETATIIGRALGLTPAPDPDLREVFLGSWQGLSHAEIAVRFPDEWAAWQRGEDLKRGGGETYAELGDRVSRAVLRIAEAHADRTAAIVSHGAAIKMFVARLLGLGTPGLRAFRVSHNTGVTVVERGAGGPFRLLVWNDVAHLHDAVTEAIST